MRTTIDIDDPILNEVKKLRKPAGKSLGRIISDLLAQALRQRKTSRRKAAQIRWISRGMGARIDLTDKEALYKAMEHRPPAKKKARRR